MMNLDLDRLQPYPFEKLTALKARVTPPTDRHPIALSIGEPRHAPPGLVIEALVAHLHGLSHYPSTHGSPELRTAICDWLVNRFGVPPGSLDPECNVLPVNGTREALFAFAQAVIERTDSACGHTVRPLVMMPNPFYQIYEGAALLAGAEAGFINALEDTGFLPDFERIPETDWARCQLLYLCSPGNPTGAVMGLADLQRLIRLAEEHDFIIAADECYSEIYFDEAHPPVGLLEAAARMGHTDYRRCVVFHSLSKRSNLPGMRSGFVAGDANILARFFKYRTYHGSAMPAYHQNASIQAWRDETHVQANRALYREKFTAVLDILRPVLDVQAPDAAFYLWPRTPIDDETFARDLFATQHVSVLPGRYLSRTVDGVNPGDNRVRLALVAPRDECIEAAQRICRYIESL